METITLMKTHRPLAVLVLGFAGLLTTARAQMPTTPPPPVPADLASPATASTTASDRAQSLRPTQLVYAPRLPTVQELSDVAKARGFAIERIEQTSTQIVVAYRLPDGRASEVGYALLANANAAAAAVVTPAPVVIYEPSPRVVTYTTYYDPWYYYPPVSLSLGFGFGPYYHGGYHGGWRGHGGRWHR